MAEKKKFKVSVEVEAEGFENLPDSYIQLDWKEQGVVISPSEKVKITGVNVFWPITDEAGDGA